MQIQKTVVIVRFKRNVPMLGLSRKYRQDGSWAMMKIIFEPFTNILGVYGTIVFFVVLGSIGIIIMVIKDVRK